MTSGFTLGELARRVGGVVVGDEGRRLGGVATLEGAGPTDLAFWTHPRYRRAAEATRAGAVLVATAAELEGHDLLRTEEPYVALAEILELFHPASIPPRGVSPDARVDPSARLGEGVSIGPFVVVGARAGIGARSVLEAGVVVGDDCEIGEETRIYPNVTLYEGTRVGARCTLHAGVVLGADGFGFATTRGRHRKVPQVGRVVVEDDVEIGANSAIDRGAIGDTVIGEGTKIDDLVMIAHGVRLGPHGLLAAQAGIAGSTRVGRAATFAGQSGAAGHLELGDGAVVGAKSAVFEDLEPGSFVAGIPAIDHRAWKRAQSHFRRLPELRSELRSLRERLEALESGRSKDGK